MFMPADVESGLACGCQCPECGAFLVAKKGDVNAWHFAHHRIVATQSCVETAIHAAAKQVLLEANWLQVPEKSITVSGQTKYGVKHTISNLIAASRAIRFDFSREEVWETNLRPDVIGYRADRRILVEMLFTHQVDDAKRRKLEVMGLPAIEIDLSNLEPDAGFDAVRQRVLHDIAEREWLFYPGEKEAKAALSITLDEEIAHLNIVHERKLAAQQRKNEARQHKAERVLQEIADANERYRAMSLAEKEHPLRESLGITGAWPYYINLPSPEASAIGEPPRIWQAALFSRFIFGKKTAESRLQVNTLLEWVVGRFGLVDNRTADARAAVKKFLGYLRACGFLAKSPYNPYETDYYTVVRDELIPLTRQQKREVNLEASAPNATAMVLPAIIKPHWQWSASWPDKVEMLKTANTLLESSPHKELLLRAIEPLSPQTRPNEPYISALLLQRQDVPLDATLDFLVEVGLAFKGSRTI